MVARLVVGSFGIVAFPPQRNDMKDSPSRRDAPLGEHDAGSFTWTPEWWQDWTEKDHGTRSYVLSTITESALMLLKPSPGDLVLNVGCGYGREAKALLHRFPTARIIGIDASTSMIVDAKNNLPNRFDAAQGSASELPFDDNTFDHILCIGVLMHVRDEFPACREMIRVLRPGGRLIVSFNSVLHPLGFAVQHLLSHRKRNIPGYKQIFRLPHAYTGFLRKLGCRVRLHPGTFALGNEPAALLRALRYADRYLAAIIPWATFEPILQCEKRS